MPNPLTDELTPQAKDELAVKFRELARRFESRRVAVPADPALVRRFQLRELRQGW